MKHKTWFRLVIRAIGIAMLAFSLPHLTWNIISLFAYSVLDPYGSGGPTPGQILYQYGPNLLHNVIQIAVGLYLLLGGRWLIDLCIPSNRPYCPNCGYDLSHNIGERCSECGVTLPPRESPPPT